MTGQWAVPQHQQCDSGYHIAKNGIASAPYPSRSGRTGPRLSRNQRTVDVERLIEG